MAVPPPRDVLLCLGGPLHGRMLIGDSRFQHEIVMPRSAEKMPCGVFDTKEKGLIVYERSTQSYSIDIEGHPLRVLTIYTEDGEHFPDAIVTAYEELVNEFWANANPDIAPIVESLK